MSALPQKAPKEDETMKHIKSPGRREFIRRGGLLMTGTTAYTLVPNYAWAADDPLLEALAFACHAMYPHDHVPFKHYKACAQGLLDKAEGDPALRGTLEGGVARLDAFGSRPFAQLSEADRELALQRVEGSDFFSAVRGHTVVGLYNIPEIWQYFGYQGPSFPQGGYLERGFDDIFWLRDI